MQPAADFKRLLTALTDADVRFIVVGGVSAVLQGAPISTFDLDIVPEREAVNIQKLMNVLAKLHAIYRGQFGRVLEPNATALEGPGHNLLITDAGPMDVLGTIGASFSYQDLIPFSTSMRLLGDRSVLVLKLSKLIEIKEQLGSPKDIAALPVLKRTLEERKE